MQRAQEKHAPDVVWLKKCFLASFVGCHAMGLRSPLHTLLAAGRIAAKGLCFLEAEPGYAGRTSVLQFNSAEDAEIAKIALKESCQHS